jgi:hypothetical protein
VISDSESGKVYGAWPVKEGTEFAIEFVHSVNQSPVRDMFVVKGRRIRQTATRFSSFGAGMRSDLEPGETLTRDGDALVLNYRQDLLYPELRYIVGTVSDHTLFIYNEALSLRNLCGRNAHVRIQVRRQP